ncbi:MAG: hypothetical protein H6815_05820 [Phycisphaeraceae bacterium]|nr:hypothetical protein [Phycisphaerales bacterium]MCB9859956.1 hypothetical protein [Phycisphaeraceae bacterium]
MEVNERTENKAFRNVKEILSRLDRSIDSVRRQRLDPPVSTSAQSAATPTDPRRMRAQPLRPRPIAPSRPDAQNN